MDKYKLTIEQQSAGGYVKNRRMTREERREHCRMMAIARWGEKKAAQKEESPDLKVEASAFTSNTGY